MAISLGSPVGGINGCCGRQGGRMLVLGRVLVRGLLLPVAGGGGCGESHA